jgi:hypothetical protein
MAEISKFFNSAPGDPRTYQASDFADYFGSVLSTGLLHTDNIPALEVKCEGTDLRTYVTPGKAIIQGYLYENTSDLYLEHAIPEPTLDRIDRIVLRLDKRNQSRFIKLFVIQGEPAENPVPPSLTRDEFIYELSLAQIRVRANTSTLNPADMVDERLDENFCGLVSSLITIPTSQFQQQWDDFMADIQDNGFVSQTDFDAHLAPTATNAHLAKNIGIEDPDGNFTSADVEGALKEAIEKANAAFTSASNGKSTTGTLAMAITGKGGALVDGDSDGIYTFQELTDGVNSINVGKYDVGDILPTTSVEGPVYAEVFDTQHIGGWSIDDSKNVYYWNGTTIYKKDYNANLLWSKAVSAYLSAIYSIAVTKNGSYVFLGGRETGSDYGKIIVLSGSNGSVVNSNFDREYSFPYRLYVSDSNNGLYCFWNKFFTYHSSDMSGIYRISGASRLSKQTSTSFASDETTIDFSPNGDYCYFANGSSMYRFYFDGTYYTYQSSRGFSTTIIQVNATSGGVYGYHSSVDSSGYHSGHYWANDNGYYSSSTKVGTSLYGFKTLVYRDEAGTKFALDDTLVLEGAKEIHKTKSGSSTWYYRQQGNSNWLFIPMVLAYENSQYTFYKYEKGYKILE